MGFGPTFELHCYLLTIKISLLQSVTKVPMWMDIWFRIGTTGRPL